MRNNLILGLDVGTTTCKVIIFDLEKKKYSSVLKEYCLRTEPGGRIEIDADNLWRSISEGIGECIHKSRCNPEDIRAISYSVLGSAIAAISKEGKVLYPFIEAWDSRDNNYSKYSDLVLDRIGEDRLFEITGNYLVYSSINKILWLHDNRKDIFSKVWKFMCVGDFITFKLTGFAVIDPSMASTMMTFDINKGDYSNDILNKLELDRRLFPDILSAGEVVGSIKTEIADSFGFSKDIKVVAGSFDQICSALGVGNIKEGIVSDGIGTVECIGITTNEPNTSKLMMENIIPCNPHAVKGRFFSWGVHLAAGMMLKWYKDNFCYEEMNTAKRNNLDVYDLITNNASKSPPGSNSLFILPHLRGSGLGIKPALNSNSKCSIIGLNISHNKNDVSRAVLEGVVFESKLVINTLDQSGIKIEEIRVTGGGAKSDLWLQMRANILNKKITVPEFKDCGLMGAIILASIGIENYSSFKEAVSDLIKIEKVFTPENKEITSLYQKHFEVYKKIYPTLLPLYMEITNL